MAAEIEMRQDLAEAVSLLRELEWAGCQSQPYDGCTSACPSCGAESRHEQTVPPRTGINRTDEPMLIVHRDGKHEPDCRLADVLRKHAAPDGGADR